MNSPLRIGLIGAGSNTKLRHIPGFQSQPDVQVTAVTNRTRASAEQVAKEFHISHVFDDWQELVQSPDIDAICIGTWPNLHAAATIAALKNGKHVLCEARMAMNESEARAMLHASKARPDLIAQLVPAPYTLWADATIVRLINEGFLGTLLGVDLTFRDAQFPHSATPMTWRQDASLSGVNTLALGIFYETLMRWIGPADHVAASTRVHVPIRKKDGVDTIVTVPDHLEVLADLPNGALARLSLSAVTGFAPPNACWLFGSEGTLKVNLSEQKLEGGKKGGVWGEITPGPAEKSGWRVEESFVRAIRGQEPVRLTTFDDGVRYMAFTEAVITSARTGTRLKINNN